MEIVHTMTNDDIYIPRSYRLPPEQIDFLSTQNNASQFIREAIELKRHKEKPQSNEDFIIQLAEKIEILEKKIGHLKIASPYSKAKKKLEVSELLNREIDLYKKKAETKEKKTVSKIISSFKDIQYRKINEKTHEIQKKFYNSQNRMLYDLTINLPVNDSLLFDLGVLEHKQQLEQKYNRKMNALTYLSKEKILVKSVLKLVANQLKMKKEEYVGDIQQEQALKNTIIAYDKKIRKLHQEKKELSRKIASC